MAKPKADNDNDTAAQLKGKELARRAAEGDPDAAKALEKIVVSFERWKKLLGDKKDIDRKAKELEGGAAASFENAIEAGLPSNADANDVHAKLRGVEKSWQAQKEAIQQASLMRSEIAEKVKKAAGKLERASQDGAQLTIPVTDG